MALAAIRQVSSATLYGVVPQLAASTPVIARGSSPAQCNER